MTGQAFRRTRARWMSTSSAPCSSLSLETFLATRPRDAVESTETDGLHQIISLNIVHRMGTERDCQLRPLRTMLRLLIPRRRILACMGTPPSR